MQNEQNENNHVEGRSTNISDISLQHSDLPKYIYMYKYVQYVLPAIMPLAPQPPCCICKASSASGTAVAATVVSSGTVVCSGTVVSSGTAVCSADVDSAGAGWKVPMARHCSRAVTRRSKDSKVEENVLRWEEHENLGRTTSDAFAKPFFCVERIHVYGTCPYINPLRFTLHHLTTNFRGPYIFNPKPCTLNGKCLNITIHWHCLIHPKNMVHLYNDP